ncbi:bcl-2-binding component 3-like isoform X1 [Carex littledalei]|uniref:Bcl-2-binding component 3-like isoform X1 n=1 Tax=Carex littledalei TaxID=544730 RepID=A0A833V5A5_9POAL|nr:bcl-2-binding component 3-like isoform X1 [Carex littledalei]
MAVCRPAMAIALVLWISMANSLAMAASKFDEVIQPSWANDHIIYDGDLLMLKLDNSSGTGFASKSKYLYGKATAEMKLVPGDSAGTVTAFYLLYLFTMEESGEGSGKRSEEGIGKGSGKSLIKIILLSRYFVSDKEWLKGSRGLIVEVPSAVITIG